MKRSVLAGLVMALAMTLLGSTAQATPTRQASDADKAALAQAQYERDEAAVIELAPYYDSKTTTLDAKGALAAGIDHAIVTDFQRGLAMVPGLLTQVALTASSTTPDAQLAASGCVGARGVIQKLAYFRLYANSCDARSIIAAMNAGSGVAGLTAVIAGIFGALPLTVVAGIAAALLQFGQAAVNYCSRRGRGMVMQNVYWPPCYNQ